MGSIITRRLSLLSAFLMLSGCQFEIAISVGGSVQAPTFKLKRAGLFSFGPQIFEKLTVFPNHGRDNDNWRVEAMGDRCGAGARTVVYGQVPQHFKQTQFAAPLKEGEIYVIVAEGCGSTGATSFKIDRGRVVEIEHGLSSIPAQTIQF